MFDVFRLILEISPHVGDSPLFAVIPAAIAVPAAASVVGGLINGISSLFGSHKRASTEEKINQQNIAMQRETNALNKQMADESNALQYQMFNEANQFTAQQKSLEMQYNSPIEQKNRALAAGINPNITDMGNVQGASSVSSSNPTTPQFQSPQAFQPTPFEIPRFGDMFNGLASILLQSRALDIEQEKADYEGEKTDIQRSDSETKRREQQATERHQDESRRLQEDLQDVTMDSLRKSIEQMQSQIDSTKLNDDLNAARLAMEQKMTNSNIGVNSAQAANLFEGVHYMITQANVLANQDWRSEQSHVLEMNAKKFQNEWLDKLDAVERAIVVQGLIGAYNRQNEANKSFFARGTRYLFGIDPSSFAPTIGSWARPSNVIIKK